MGRFHLQSQIKALKKRVDETEDKGKRRVLMDRHNQLLIKLKGMKTVEDGTLRHICGWCDTVVDYCQCRQS